MSPQKPSLVIGATNTQQGHEARPSDPQRLSFSEPIEGKIDLIHVLHHLPELLRLHQRRRCRNRKPPSAVPVPVRRSRRFLGPLRLPAAAAEIVDGIGVGIEEGPVGGGILGRESEAAEVVVMRGFFFFLRQ